MLRYSPSYMRYSKQLYGQEVPTVCHIAIIEALNLL